VNISTHALVLGLQAAAALQIGIAILNLFLSRILDWEEELRKASKLLNEVFHVHSWFISITVAIFGLMSWRFAGELAGNGPAIDRWLAGCIGLFWGIRTVMQVAYYSSSHWRGKPGRTMIHLVLLLIYGGFAAVYGLVALNHSNALASAGNL
jgi:hypothetical protein